MTFEDVWKGAFEPKPDAKPPGVPSEMEEFFKTAPGNKKDPLSKEEREIHTSLLDANRQYFVGLREKFVGAGNNQEVVDSWMYTYARVFEIALEEASLPPGEQSITNVIAELGKVYGMSRSERAANGTKYLGGVVDKRVQIDDRYGDMYASRIATTMDKFEKEGPETQALVARLLYRGLYDHVLKLTRGERDPAAFVNRVIEIDHMYDLLGLLRNPNEDELKKLGGLIRGIGAGVMPSIGNGSN
jgi:hypothetical protein